MTNEYQSVESLIENVKGTTGFLSSLLTPKLGLAFMLIVLGVIAANVLF
ncbi:MAG: hypothetical protein PVJ21_10055 [Anaerolineales bacterium]|jgi:hypothetical protein